MPDENYFLKTAKRFGDLLVGGGASGIGGALGTWAGTLDFFDKLNPVEDIAQGLLDKADPDKTNYAIQTARRMSELLDPSSAQSKVLRRGEEWFNEKDQTRPQGTYEKTVHGLASAPGTVAGLLPYMVGAGEIAGGSKLLGSALGMAAAGASNEVSPDEPLDASKIIPAALKGGAEGLAFGSLGRVAAPLKTAAGRTAAHAGGSAAIGGLSAFLGGGDTSDILSSAAVMGGLGATGYGREKKIDKLTKIQEGRQQYQKLLESGLDPESKAAADIRASFEEPSYNQPGIFERIGEQENKAGYVARLIDRHLFREYEPVETAIKQAGGDKEVLKKHGGYYQNALTSDSKVDQFMKRGVADITRTKQRSEGDSIVESAKKLGITEKEYWIIDSYYQAKHRNELRVPEIVELPTGERVIKEKNVAGNPNTDRLIIERVENDPQFADIKEKAQSWKRSYDRYFSDILDYSVDAGVITAADKKQIQKYRNYYPQVFEGKSRRGFNEEMPGNKAADPFRALTENPWHGDPRMDIARATLEWSKKAVETADRSEYLQFVMDKLKDSEIVRDVTGAQKYKNLQDVKATKAAEEAGFGAEDLMSRNIQADPNTGIIKFYKDGKEVYYKIEDKALFEALTKPWGSQWKLWGAFHDIFSGAKRGMVLGMTGLNARFGWVTNPIRDVMTTYFTADRPGLGAVGRTLKYGTARNLAEWGANKTSGKLQESFKKAASVLEPKYPDISEALKIAEGRTLSDIERAKLGGVGFSGMVGTELRGNPYIRDKMLLTDAQFAKRHSIESFKSLISATENMARYAEEMDVFNRTVRELGDNPTPRQIREASMIAARAGADVTVNFRRMGKTGRVLNQYIPFFNPQLQGLARIAEVTMRDYERSREAGRGQLRSVASAAAPTMFKLGPTMVGLWMWNKYSSKIFGEDESNWYDEVPIWERMMFAHLRVPKEVAGLIGFDSDKDTILRAPLPFEFAAPAAMMVATLEAISRDDPEYFYNSMKQEVNQLFPTMMPSIIGPIADVWGNEDRFRDVPIETMYEQSLMPEERYRENTPDVYRSLSKATRGTLSPLQLKHLAEGYTGGMARTATSLTGMLGGGEAERTASDVPIVGTLVSRSNRYGQSVDTFYKRYSKALQIKNSINANIKRGNYDRARELQQENADELRKLKMYQKIAERISQARRAGVGEEVITNLAKMGVGI